MGSRKRTPTFNLNAVVQETGVKPDALRAWERRYGLPKPERTPGGHRIYSQRDIETLKWLVARQHEGLSISRAVDLWRQYIENGDDPLVEHPLGEKSRIQFTPGQLEAQPLEKLRTTWIDACLSFDENQAEQTLTTAFALFPMETVCIEIIQSGLSTIGQLWYEGTITVHQEHFASTLALRRVESLLESMPPPSRKGKIIVFCPSEEEHIFPALLLTFLLRRRGYDVVFLGANVPIDHLDQTIQKIRPVLAIAAAQTLTTAANLLQMANLLAAENIPLGYGGLFFNHNPQVHQRIPGNFLGETIPQALQKIEEMHSTGGADFIHPVSMSQNPVLMDFLANTQRIRAELESLSAESNSLSSIMRKVSFNLFQAIEAALILGEIDLVKDNLHWLQGLLANRESPPEQLQDFLDAFLTASRAGLGSDGMPIVHWLENIDLSTIADRAH